MKKFLLSGIMGLGFFFAQGQVWKQLYDSTNYFWATDWPKTINLLLKAREDAALALGPEDPLYQSIIEDLGIAYWQNKQFEAARPYLTASLNQGRRLNQGAHSADLINVLMHLATSDLTNLKGLNTKAILHWIVYNEQKPDDALLYYGAVVNLMNLYNRQGLYDSAVNVANRVNKQNGGNWLSNPEWNLLVARTQFSAGNLNDAAALTEKILRLKNSSQKVVASTYNLRGEIFTAIGNHKSAAHDMKKSARISKKLNDSELFTETYKNQINAYVAEKNFAKAAQMCDAFLQTSDQSILSTQHFADIKNIKANIAFLEGRYAEAISIYEDLLPVYPRFVKESHPVFVALLDHLAQAYVKTDQLHRAYVYLRWAYEMVNTRETRQADLAVNILTNLAEVYASKGDAQQADQHLRESENA